MEKVKLIQRLLNEYGESHQNALNKTIHWICVPLIFFSIVGIFMSIPFPFERTALFNWAGLALILALLYYMRLSLTLFIGFIFVALLCLYLNYSIYVWTGFSARDLFLVDLSIFVLAWIGQFYGHKVEGKKPSFLKDLQFLLIGPAWLMHFIYKKLGIPY